MVAYDNGQPAIVTHAECVHCGVLLTITELRDLFGNLVCIDTVACNERYDVARGKGETDEREQQ